MATKAQTQTPDRAEPSRRRAPRFELPAPVDVTVMRAGVADSMPGRSVNICERGIALVLAGELVPGESVNIELMLPDVADPIQTRAVVKHQSGFSCGMEFRGLSADQRAVIRECVKRISPESGAANTAEKQLEPIVAVSAIKPKRSVDVQLPVSISRSKTINDWLPSSGWTLFLIAAVMVVLLFWWRWNLGWEELESNIRSQETTVEKPQERVLAEEMERLLVHRVEPIYPAEARKNNLQAIIALDVVIGRDGSVLSVKPLNGPDILARAAVDALRWWKFQPYRVNGNPVAVETTMAVEFKP